MLLLHLCRTNLLPKILSPGRRSSVAALIAAMSLYVGAAANASTPPAFPDAKGWGSLAQGGRGGKVLIVTTLADDAANPPVGSLRWALNQTGPRTIVFDVGGVIRLKDTLYVGHDEFSASGMPRGYVTIAGQSAPAPGITITPGSNFPNGRKAVVRIANTEEVLLRHLRIRGALFQRPDGTQYFDGSTTRYQGLDTLQISAARRIMLDHCSISWATDESVSINDGSQRPTPLPREGYPLTEDITFQHCLLSECIDSKKWPSGNHDSGAMLVFGCPRLTLSLFGNAFWNNEQRSPLVQPYIDESYFADKQSHYRVDISGSVIGTSSTTGGFRFQYSGSDMDSVMDISLLGIRTFNAFWDFRPPTSTDAIYRTHFRDCREINGTPLSLPPSSSWHLHRGDPHFIPNMPDRTTSPSWSNEALNGLVGAIFPQVDAIDATVHNAISQRIITVPSTLAAASQRIALLDNIPNSMHPPTRDADRDGMPDSWENVFGVQDPNEDFDCDGYTALEEYLNSTSPVTSDYSGELSPPAPSIRADQYAGGWVSVHATTASRGSLGYSWELEDANAPGHWTTLTNGAFGNAMISGSTTATLLVSGLTENAPLGQVRVRVTSSCGPTVSMPLLLIRTSCAPGTECPCAADFNGDAVVDLFDYLDFVAAFSSGC